MNENVQISAEIILNSHSGKAILDSTLITSENLIEYLPSEETVIKVTQFFDNEGFDTYPVVGISLTIYGDIGKFSQLFDVEIDFSERNGSRILNELQEYGRILPTDKLPLEISELIQVATFPEPPEFHSSDFFF